MDCNDDAGGAQTSRVARVVDPGTYYIVVDGDFGASGAFTLRAKATPRPERKNRERAVTERALLDHRDHG